MLASWVSAAMRAQCCNKAWPISVGSSRCALRLTSTAPTWRSSALSLRLKVGLGTRSRSAAWLILPLPMIPRNNISRLRSRPGNRLVPGPESGRHAAALIDTISAMLPPEMQPSYYSDNYFERIRSELQVRNGKRCAFGVKRILRCGSTAQFIITRTIYSEGRHQSALLSRSGQTLTRAAPHLQRQPRLNTARSRCRIPQHQRR